MTGWIKVVLSRLHRLVARHEEVLRNREVRELLAPCPPLAYLPQGPSPVDVKILTTTLVEGMHAIRSWVNTNVEKVVVEELKELLGGL